MTEIHRLQVQGLTDEEIIASLNHIEEGQTHTISDIKEAVLSGSSIIKK